MRASLLTFLAFAAACSAARVPGKYVVELDNLQALKGAKRSFSSPHEVLYNALDKRGIDFEVSSEYNTAGIFVGASLSLAPEDVKTVAAMPGVINVRYVLDIPALKPINARVATVGDPTLPDSETTHIMTGVDKVHAQGITGKGIKIGIIDTGVDYTHPTLGDGFGPGHKIFEGYDFVGDAYNGSNTPVPDNNPLDQCNGHGTHVAGIIGANPGNQFNISGVAYDASLASYRVFGCSGSVTDDIIIDALLRGYSDGMDILTLSLGGVEGWSESSSSVVASRLADKGVVVTIAAGNDGDYGAWYASSPGTGLDVIAVASVDNIVIPMQNATLHGVNHDPIPYLSALPLNVTGDLPVYATSTDTSNPADACDPLPDSTPDLSGHLVVVRRGTCDFTQKLANVAAKGGNVVFIYNNVEAFAAITVGNYTAVLISPEDGAYLVNQFAAGVNVSVSFPTTGGAYNYPDPSGGLISDFSTYGPTYDMDFKPAVAAPGGNILSTLPLTQGGWGVDSGTSMATPFVAGSSALVLQAKGKSAAKGMRDLFQATANPIGSSHTDADPLQTLSQQGAGLIQVNTAIKTTTVVSPGQITLNDTAHFNPFHTFTIKNNGHSAVTYKLSHVPAGTAVTIVPGTIMPADGPLNLTTEYAKVVLSPSEVTVGAGRSALVLATFVPPKVHDPSTWPVYSGYIEVASSSETQRVSYLGAVGDLGDKQVIDTTDSFFGFQIPAIVNNTGVPGVNSSYTLEGDDQPQLLYRLVFGSPLVRLDLVSKSFTLPSHKRGLFSWWWGSNIFSLGSIKTLGALAEFDYTPRNSDAGDAADNGWNEYYLNGTYTDGTTINDGQYKIVLRALRVTGNPESQSDYETWLSPVLTIKRH